MYLLKSLQVLCPTRAGKHVQERNSSGEFTWQTGSTGTTDNAKSARCRQLLASVRMNLLPTFSLKPTPSSFHNLFQCVLGLHLIDSAPRNLKSIIRELTFYWKRLSHFSSFHFPLMCFFPLKLSLFLHLLQCHSLSFRSGQTVHFPYYNFVDDEEVLKGTAYATFSNGSLMSFDIYRTEEKH